MSLENIFLSLMTSAIGFAYIVYARKQRKFWFAISGAALMSYTYFVDSLELSLTVATLLIAAPFIAQRV